MVLLMPLHPKTPLSLASFKSRLVLLFWYQLTQVVLEKRSLNGCSSSFVVFSLTQQCHSQSEGHLLLQLLTVVVYVGVARWRI